MTSSAARQVKVGWNRAGDLPRIEMEGASIHAITEARCVEHIMSELNEGRGGCVVTMNLDHLRRFSRDADYARCNRRADVVTADGMPLVWASRLRGTPLPERVTGSNLIWSLSEAAAREGRSLLLMGGAPGTAEKTALILQQRFPGLIIAGVLADDVCPSRMEEAKARLFSGMREARPDIVFMGLGSPKQEVLAAGLREWAPQAWWLGVGITFSFVSGTTRRAPLWMQKSGLEWVHRLAQEPRRLAKRYLIDDLPFAALLMARSLRYRFRS